MTCWSTIPLYSILVFPADRHGCRMKRPCCPDWHIPTLQPHFSSPITPALHHACYSGDLSLQRLFIEQPHKMPPSRKSTFVSPFFKSFFSSKTKLSSQSSFENRCETTTIMSSAALTDSSDLDIVELASKFKKNVTIKDRRWRLQTYKNCFVGSEAVQWLVTSGTANTRADAVKLGLLMQEAGLIEHCVRDHE